MSTGHMTPVVEKPQSASRMIGSMGTRLHRGAWWRFTAKEMRVHAILLAAVLWTVAGVIAFAGSGYRSVFGPLKGADFIYFYTMAHLDARTAASVAYDPEALYRVQVQLVPESAPEHRLSVYPPQAILLFRPLAGMTYGAAALTWAAVLAAVYALCIWLAWRPFKAMLPDTRLLVAAAAGFPPFWHLVVHGQSTVVPLLGFCLGWLALEHRRRFWAGMAFGLLLLKPQFAIVLVPLALACSEWAMIAGAALCIALQALAVAVALDPALLWSYAAIIPQLLQAGNALSPRPEQMHSIAALTHPLPAPWVLLFWAALSTGVIAATIRVWRTGAPIVARLAVLVLASVLVNPHVFTYDAVVLAPALVWIGAWLCMERDRPLRTRSAFGPLSYSLFFSLFAPTAAVLPIQASVVILGGLFVLVSLDVLRSPALPATAAPHHRANPVVS